MKAKGHQLEETLLRLRREAEWLRGQTKNDLANRNPDETG